MTTIPNWAGQVLRQLDGADTRARSLTEGLSRDEPGPSGGGGSRGALVLADPSSARQGSPRRQTRRRRYSSGAPEIIVLQLGGSLAGKLSRLASST